VRFYVPMKIAIKARDVQKQDPVLHND